MYVCATHAILVPNSQKRVLDSLELELRYGSAFCSVLLLGFVHSAQVLGYIPCILTVIILQGRWNAA